MAKATVATLRRQVSTKKSTKQLAKVQAIAPVDRLAVNQGNKCIAAAKGVDPIAVAVGDNCRAVADVGEDSHMASVVAAGTGCTAEVNGHPGCLAVVAVGISSNAVSNVEGVASVAIGYNSLAKAPSKGTAISIGWGPDVGLSCQAGEGGYLVFLDTNGTEPKVAVFKVDPDQGIWPNIPYQWCGGWTKPCPDWERMDREGFERGVEFERKHPGAHKPRSHKVHQDEE